MRTARQEAGWTQERLAQEAGITRKHLSQIESGQAAHPSFDVIERLAAALQLTITLPLGHEPLRGATVSARDVAERLVQLRGEIDAIVSTLSRPGQRSSEQHQAALMRGHFRELVREMEGQPADRQERVLTRLSYIVPRLLRGDDVVLDDSPARETSSGKTHQDDLRDALITPNPTRALAAPVSSKKNRRRRSAR